jgi:hypothetical protein
VRSNEFTQVPYKRIIKQNSLASDLMKEQLSSEFEVREGREF